MHIAGAVQRELDENVREYTKSANIYWIARKKMLTRKKMYPWMSYAAAHAYELEAERLGVSSVARSTKGFMREYELAKKSHAMNIRPLPRGVTGGTTWGQKRNGFVARHLAQYKQNPTRRRFLALVMWAYDPTGNFLRSVPRRRHSSVKRRDRS